MSEIQTNLMQAQESLFFLLKEITDKSDEEIKNLSIKFLDQVQKKLSNSRFVDNAPEKVIQVERNKQSDAMAKIKAIKDSLNSLQ